MANKRKNTTIAIPLDSIYKKGGAEELNRICKILDKRSVGYASPFKHPIHGDYILITREGNYREAIKGYEDVAFKDE